MNHMEPSRTFLARCIATLALAIWPLPAWLNEATVPGQTPERAAAAQPAKGALPNSLQIEKDLQRLSWNQFRFVIESIPELRAEVDAYGPFGWQYVQSKYPTHGWRKNVDRLDPAEKRRLVKLIQVARKTR